MAATFLRTFKSTFVYFFRLKTFIYYSLHLPFSHFTAPNPHHQTMGGDINGKKLKKFSLAAAAFITRWAQFNFQTLPALWHRRIRLIKLILNPSWRSLLWLWGLPIKKPPGKKMWKWQRTETRLQIATCNLKFCTFTPGGEELTSSEMHETNPGKMLSNANMNLNI